VVTLFGPLGAGKTTLVQGVGEGLGVSEIINSPTFTMLNEYHSGRLPLYHLDLYRVQDDPSSQTALGGKSYELLRAELDEFITHPGITLIEWAETIESYLPPDHLSIRLDYAGTGEDATRIANISGRGSQTALLAERVAGMLISS
jgi:tRNA threonylcarbamoyladenosine biosynthesis protein TsaE